jgi:hypothetical protein
MKIVLIVLAKRAAVVLVAIPKVTTLGLPCPCPDGSDLSKGKCVCADGS